MKPEPSCIQHGLRNSETPPNPFWSTIFSEIYIKDSVSYYMQKTASTWQADWRSGAGTPQLVTIDWSDNITGLGGIPSVIHVENVLYQAPVDEAGNPADLMNSYVMTHLFGARYSEKFGTTGAVLPTNYRTIFSPNARLIIEKITGKGLGRDPVYNGGLPVLDKAVYEGIGGDGPAGTDQRLTAPASWSMAITSCSRSWPERILKKPAGGA
ncbi:MAG: hypothetical protein IPQ16_14630 [Geobacteraceae bacterium]|nr:hypothetical protein [Geobacteraceae bacterium]